MKVYLVTLYWNGESKNTAIYSTLADAHKYLESKYGESALIYEFEVDNASVEPKKVYHGVDPQWIANGVFNWLELKYNIS